MKRGIEIKDNTSPIAPGINVGASVAAVEAARLGVIDILSANVDNSTKVVALKAFADICEVKYVTISGNHITMPPVR